MNTKPISPMGSVLKRTLFVFPFAAILFYCLNNSFWITSFVYILLISIISPVFILFIYDVYKSDKRSLFHYLMLVVVVVVAAILLAGIGALLLANSSGGFFI